MKHTLSATILALGVLTCGVTYAEPAAGTAWTEPRTGMEFIWAPTGCFDMGSNDGESDEQPVHKVCLKGFWIGKYEVTQGQYQQVMGKNPSYFQGATNPVDSVNIEDVGNFTEEMSYRTGTKVRLLSEAEWEYACRAGGAHRKYCGGGGRPERLGWYDGNSDGSTHPVGQLASNDWGLHDMGGNVFEWTQDCWNDSYSGAPADGSARGNGRCAERVIRGGSWYIGAADMGATNRSGYESGNRCSGMGLRLARTLP